jgi:hypothetical protein
LRDLAAYLRAKGVEEATVAWQIRRLTVSDFQADPSPQPSLREEVRNLRGPDPLREQDSATELADSSDDDNDEDDTPALLSPEGPPSTLVPPGLDDEPALAELLHDEPPWPIAAIPLAEGQASDAGDGIVTPTGPVPEDLAEASRLAAVPDEKPHGFIVSIAKGGLHRKLHFFGACFRVPGIHYRHFRTLGELMPSEYDMDSKCLDCFPGNKLEADTGGRDAKTRFLDSDEETFSTAFSSSAAEAGPPPRRARRQ